MNVMKKQARFAQCVALLVLRADQMGYHVTFGDAYRDARCNYGHPNSVHRKRMGIDINLFNENGRYLQNTEDHLPLGQFWESLDEDARWGGRFGDGNHYSFEHDGVK